MDNKITYKQLGMLEKFFEKEDENFLKKLQVLDKHEASLLIDNIIDFYEANQKAKSSRETARTLTYLLLEKHYKNI